MKLNSTEISKSLNKAYLKQDLTREQIETFKSNLKVLFSKAKIAGDKKEHEEHFKNIVSEFLKDTYYKNNFEININKRKDLVIHNGKSPADSVGVIIEAKKPSNEVEMISAKMPNSKALHELILYYFEEREGNKNVEVKHLVANNMYDWFIFDENEFDKMFYRNSLLQKLYQAKVSQSKDNPFFYSEAAKIIDGLDIELKCTHFNFKDYEKAAFNNSNADDTELINLYKILSPEHLLKRPFANDSNTLNKAFYNELLHIIGLEEKPEGGKKLITRKKIENRDDASLLENTINKLKVDNCLGNFVQPEQFGDTPEEQIYSLGLELCITWLNRILFLKLLEGQLINYHNGNKEFGFMNIHSIADFDELNELFFEVLAEEYQNRSKTVNAKFGYIPYLNSSLFEKSEIEKRTFSISNLKDRLELGLYPHSVMFKKDENKQSTKKITLHYLMEFLSAYNFSSDSSAKIQEDNKNMINASVLGLIFEKINGYKDGSFFTPGFITMYMCRETIRRAVAQKFKELENKDIDNFEDVKNYSARYFKKEDLARFNKHIDSLKICDPAVGSGHFLVSALNEIIAIKSELNILVDQEGTPLEYEITVDNDELTILNKKTNKPFEYLLGIDNKPPKALQQVQVSLFQEKQKIIENCLFGVDINPKSVLICRLRLWIELLKNAYYKPINEGLTQSQALIAQELETLPNIDINIKCGNSLISRFPINSNLKQLAKTSKWTIFSYQNAVQSYKKSTDKNVKRDLEKLIKDIKSNYVNAIQQKNPTLQKYYKLKQEYDYKFPENGLFAHEPEQDYGGNKKKREDEKLRLATELKKVEVELTEEKLFFEKNNAFEWRFEFPEVLNDDGDFVGFDVVIGNPPYGIKFDEGERLYYKDFFKNIHVRTPESFNYFWGLSTYISDINGLCTYITPSSFLSQVEFEKTRKLILENYKLYQVINLGDDVFGDAATPTCITGYLKKKDEGKSSYSNLSGVERNLLPKTLAKSENKIDISSFSSNESFSFVYKPYKSILDKCYKFPVLKEVAEDVATGVSPGLGDAFVVDEKLAEHLKLERDLLKNLIIGSEINHYSIRPTLNKRLIYCTLDTKLNDFPNTKKHLTTFKTRLDQRVETISGTIPWFVMLRPRRQKLFENPKILIRQTANKIIAAFDKDKWYCLKSGLIIQLPENSDIHYLYLLALLNSKLFDFLYHDLVNEDNRIFPEVKTVQLFKLPICKGTKKQQSSIINLAQNIHDAKLKKIETIELENQIDQLIYQLYGLTPEEIAIVEGN